jgi:hypothetical protein
VSYGKSHDHTFTYILPSSSSWAPYIFRFFAGWLPLSEPSTSRSGLFFGHHLTTCMTRSTTSETMKDLIIKLQTSCTQAMYVKTVPSVGAHVACLQIIHSTVQWDLHFRAATCRTCTTCTLHMPALSLSGHRQMAIS